MEYIALSNGISIPKVGFGTYPLKGNVLREALNEASVNGYGLVDTAVGYGNNADIGDLEKADNSVLKDALISTKIDALTLRRFIFSGPLRRFAGYKQLSFLITPNIIDKAIRQSFSDLHRIDIMLLHAPYNGCLKVYDAISNLYLQNRIKAYGVSNFDVNELKLLYRERGEYPMINQTEISPYNSQKQLVEFCCEHNIVVEAYSPFGRGQLVGEFMQNPVLKEVASHYNKSVGQIILRWIVQQGMVAIVRSQNPQRIKENVEIFDFALSDTDMLAVDHLNKDLVLGANQIGKKSMQKL